jgi:hypothetical protein
MRREEQEEEKEKSKAFNAETQRRRGKMRKAERRNFLLRGIWRWYKKPDCAEAL